MPGDYYDGIIEGLSRYAWWKNGVEYVGTFGRKYAWLPLKRAIADVNAERNAERPADTEVTVDWQCSGCGRHFNWSVSMCPYCRYTTTVTTGGTQPTSTNIQSAAIAQIAAQLCEHAEDLRSDGQYTMASSLDSLAQQLRTL